MSRSTVFGLVTTAWLLLAPAARAADADDLVLDLGDVNLELRRIPKGSFTMGSPITEVGHDKDEEPVRQVTLTRDFWMQKTPVTRGQFARFVSDTRYVTEAEKGPSGGSGWDGKGLVLKKEFNWRNPGFVQADDHPVVLVTFGDANAFAAWASRKTGKRVRLPSEAEWEYAARAGTTTPWYGAKTEEDVLTVGWFKQNAGNGTRGVAQKKANAFGLFDMEGNVFQWCRDMYGAYPRDPGVDPENNQHVGADPERRVLRGGSWLRDPKRGRSAARFRNTSGSRTADHGFRLVVTSDDMLGPGFSMGVGDFAPAVPASIGPKNDADAGAFPAAMTGRSAPVESLGWLLFVAPGTAAALVLAWVFGRRRVAGSTMRAGTIIRESDDGFYVRMAHAKPGTRLRYACLVAGTEVTDVVPLDGAEETFVYTGSHPSSVRVVEIAEAEAASAYRAPARTAEPVMVVVPPPPSRREPPDPEPIDPEPIDPEPIDPEPEPIEPEPEATADATQRQEGLPAIEPEDDDVTSPPPPAEPTSPTPPVEPFAGYPNAY